MMNFNPILTEINGLSPEAQGALGMAGHAIAQSAATPPPAPGVATATAPQPSLTPQGAPPPVAPMRMADANPIPTLGGSPQPNVSGPSQMDLDETRRGKLLNEGPAIDQIAHKIEGTGFGQNHPMLGKILGHAAQGAARLGNIALDVGSEFVAPGLSHLIPGTDEHHQTQLDQANQAVTQDVTNRQKESESDYQKAEGRKTDAETQTVAPLAAARESEEGAQTAHENAETEALGNPSFEVHDTDAGPLLINKKDGSAQHLSVDGQPVGDKVKLTYQTVNGPDGKPHTFGVDEKGNKVVDLGQHYERPAVSVNTGEKNLWAVPQPDGTHKVVSLSAGATVPENAVSLTGLSSEQVPTAATRTMKETAPKVIGLVDRVNQLLDANEKQLGPLDSRWDEFTAGKIGVPNQGYTQLRTDVGLLTTALMRMHVGARGGEKIMEHFQDLIDSSKQSPTNLRAALGEIKAYANTVSSEGDSQPQNSQPVSPSNGHGQQSGESPIYDEKGTLRGYTKDGKTYRPI